MPFSNPSLVFLLLTSQSPGYLYWGRQSTSPWGNKHTDVSHFPVCTTLRCHYFISGKSCSMNYDNLISITCSLIASSPPLSSTLGRLNVKSLSNKTFICQDSFLSQNINCLVITESLLSPGDLSRFNEASPSLSSTKVAQGGGVALIHKSALKCSTISVGPSCNRSNRCSCHSNLLSLSPPFVFFCFHLCVVKRLGSTVLVQYK